MSQDWPWMSTPDFEICTHHVGKWGWDEKFFFRSAILRISAVAVETRASRGRERVAEKVTGFIPVGRGVNPVHRLGLRLG